MSNENTIADIVKELNVLLTDMEAGLTIVEYSIANGMPISDLAKLTIRESCEGIQEKCDELGKIIE
jgi:hypothetical protein